jgi:hypothetical protein
LSIYEFVFRSDFGFESPGLLFALFRCVAIDPLQVPNGDNDARRGVNEDRRRDVSVQGESHLILKQAFHTMCSPRLQAEASKVLELCAREATMIFGGNALMCGGVGDKIECAVAQVKG